jgi:tRNA-dihydrouridine synthase 3
VPVPVIGNGDLLFGHEVRERLAASGATAAMTARGALIKPWIFREADEGDNDLSAEARLAIYRRYVEFAVAHWQAPPGRTQGEAPGALDDYGRERVREFLRWHVGFWVRYAPRHPDGSWPTMQAREGTFVPRSPLEALFARTDDAAIDYITDELLTGGACDAPPPPGATTDPTMVETEG